MNRKARYTDDSCSGPRARRRAYSAAVPDSDPLDNIGLKACPHCLEPMQPAGSARELVVVDHTVAAGEAYWECPARAMTAVA